MYVLVQSELFISWLEHLRDRKAKARILSRLDSATFGNLGDCMPVGEGVSEMRVHVGPGYRVYFTRRGIKLYLLLMGGTKCTQRRDIKAAIQLAQTLED